MKEEGEGGGKEGEKGGKEGVDEKEIKLEKEEWEGEDLRGVGEGEGEGERGGKEHEGEEGKEDVEEGKEGKEGKERKEGKEGKEEALSCQDFEILEEDRSKEVVKSGFLLKRGEILKTWKNRWFILQRDSTLSWYSITRTDIPYSQQQPKGSINLNAEKATIREEPTPQHEHAFIIAVAGKEFQMSSTTEAMKREWVAAIQKIMGLLDEGQEVDLIGEEFLKEQEKIAEQQERNKAKELYEKNKLARIQSTIHLLKCPLSHKMMTCPVICSDGYTYDYESAMAWFEVNNTSPVTGEVLPCFYLRPNRVLKGFLESIQEYLKANDLSKDELFDDEEGGFRLGVGGWEGGEDGGEAGGKGSSLSHTRHKGKEKKIFALKSTKKATPRGIKTRKLKDKKEKHTLSHEKGVEEGEGGGEGEGGKGREGEGKTGKGGDLD